MVTYYSPHVFDSESPGEFLRAGAQTASPGAEHESPGRKTKRELAPDINVEETGVAQTPTTTRG